MSGYLSEVYREHNIATDSIVETILNDQHEAIPRSRTTVRLRP
jgi:hypothetical protein